MVRIFSTNKNIASAFENIILPYQSTNNTDLANHKVSNTKVFFKPVTLVSLVSSLRKMVIR